MTESSYGAALQPGTATWTPIPTSTPSPTGTNTVTPTPTSYRVADVGVGVSSNTLQAAAGDRFWYNVSVYNRGPATATNGSLTLRLQNHESARLTGVVSPTQQTWWECDVQERSGACSAFVSYGVTLGFDVHVRDTDRITIEASRSGFQGASASLAGTDCLLKCPDVSISLVAIPAQIVLPIARTH